MRTMLIAFATVVGLSGAAFAMDDTDKGAAATQSEVLAQISAHGIQPTNEGYASKARIDVNPNFLPGL